MKREQVSLVIDVFSPSTLPMARLAEYLKPFAAMLGSEANVHFDTVRAGSAACSAFVDEHAAPKVRERIDGVVAGNAPRGAMEAYTDIDSLLLQDNASGHLAINNRKVIEFPGRLRAAKETIGPVRRTSSIEGQIYSIGGKDDTINVYLIDGHEEVKCVVSVDLARRLGSHLRGGRLRLFGSGNWYRIDGIWERRTFTADEFTVLDDRPLDETIAAIQETLAGTDASGLVATMRELRQG